MALDTGDPFQYTTWAALLGRWLDLARASRAIDGGDDGPWQRAIVPIITFEAIAAAITQIDRLTPPERAIALDQASLLLDARSADLETAFEEWPPMAIAAHEAASEAVSDTHQQFAWTICWEGPGPLAMPPTIGVPAGRSDEGAVATMLPGTLALPGEPIAWWTGRHEPVLARGLAGCQAMPLDGPLQVWRIFDASGLALEDRVCDLAADEPKGGVPLLVASLVDGQRLDAPAIDQHYPPANPATLPEALVPVRWQAGVLAQ